jgi:hypothetical protein
MHIDYRHITLRYLYRISICWEKLESNVLASPRQSKSVTRGNPTWNKDSEVHINNVTKIIEKMYSKHS